MTTLSQEKVQQQLGAFYLPKYQEIPNVGLYLEQVSQYIEEFFAVLPTPALTGSMISNYVKKKLLSHPQKKRYDRAQIASLILIAVTKTVLSMEDIRFFLALIEEREELPVAYDAFCASLVQSLMAISDEAAGKEFTNENLTQAQTLLHHTSVAAAHKIYLDTCYAMLRAQEAKTDGPNT